MWGILLGLGVDDGRLAVEAHLHLYEISLRELKESGWIDSRYAELLRNLWEVLISPPNNLCWDCNSVRWIPRNVSPAIGAAAG